MGETLRPLRWFFIQILNWAENLLEQGLQVFLLLSFDNLFNKLLPSYGLLLIIIRDCF